MKTRSWRTLWGMLGILLLWAHVAAAAPSEVEERVLQAIARHADREAATTLMEAWQQQTPGAVSPASVALKEGLSGHYLTAKHLMKRVVAEKSDEPSLRLGSLVLVLLEGNPPTCRQAIEELFATYPENPQLKRRYMDVLESMGLPASMPPPRAEEPAEEPGAEPTEAPTPAPEIAPTPAAREIRPVQAESVREQLLRQLAESQARATREEAARQQRAKDEQARKRREEAARLSAEKTRREEATRQAAEQARQKELARQAAEKQARQARAEAQLAARQAAEHTLVAKKTAADEARRKAEQQRALDKARQEAEQRRRLEQAEQERWLAARRNQPSAPPARSPEPRPPFEGTLTTVVKPVPIADRRVWIGEDRRSVHARLGRPKDAAEPGIERYAGLSIWYDARGRVSTFELDSAWFYGPGGVRPGLTLREVLKTLPHSDGLFHLRPTGPEATSSLYVLSTVDGTLAELQFNDEVWLSTMVRTTTPSGATHLYEDLLRKGPVRRLAPDYVFALEARRKPLP